MLVPQVSENPFDNSNNRKSFSVITIMCLLPMCRGDLLITDKQQSISQAGRQPEDLKAGLCRFFQDEFAKSEARLYVSEPVFNLHAALIAVMYLMTPQAI